MKSKFIITNMRSRWFFIKYKPSIFFWTRAVQRTCTAKLRPNTRNKNSYLVYHRFKGSDDKIINCNKCHSSVDFAKDRITLNLPDVSSFSTLPDQLVNRLVESGSSLINKLWLSFRSSNSQLVTHKICSHFAESWGFVYLVKQSQSLSEEASPIPSKTNLG